MAELFAACSAGGVTHRHACVTQSPARLRLQGVGSTSLTQSRPSPPKPAGPHVQVRLLDGITSKLAARCLHGVEKTDWHARAAEWDARAAEAARTWGGPLPKPGAAVAAAAAPVTRFVVAHGTEGARSTCRRCLKPVLPGSMRLGVRSHIPLFNHTVVSWHHPACLSLRGLLEDEAASGRPVTSAAGADALLATQVEGFKELATTERAQLCQHVLAGDRAAHRADRGVPRSPTTRPTPGAVRGGAGGGGCVAAATPRNNATCGSTRVRAP